MAIQLTVNGTGRSVEAPAEMPLLWALRDLLQLTGTKFGCGVGLCGSCKVHLDGKAVPSCLTTLGEAEGRAVTTIEGLDEAGNHPVQVAWRDLNVPQCGFCQPGQIMQAASLLNDTPSPSDQEILDAMSENVCRCGCYQRITEAVRKAATGT